jgi:hypothetical protein
MRLIVLRGKPEHRDVWGTPVADLAKVSAPDPFNQIRT